MKNILNKISRLLIFSMTLIITLFTSCNNDDDMSGGSGLAPVITQVRNYAASPNDTLVTSINPEQWIVIHGENLKNATQISFNGSPAEFNTGLFSDNTAVLQVPSSIPFNNVDPAVLNTIQYVTGGGRTTFKFELSSPPATITGNSLLASNVVGDQIFVYGTNLFLIESLTIAGVEIAPLTTVDDGSSIEFAFPEIDAPQPWEAVIVAASGTYTFNISVEPQILAVSNANPIEGDLVRVFGKNLNGISSIQFGDAAITDYTEDPDGFFVEFTAPNHWNYSSGPVTIVSTYGTATTTYNINTQKDLWFGLLANFEWGDYFGYAWWGDIKLVYSLPEFNGSMGTNKSQYVSFDTGVLASGESKYGPLGNSNTGNVWIPTVNISVPVENWGLQFEISVAKPWNGGTLYFRTEYAEDDYVARYEPWKVTATKTTDFETDGWQTVTIPLTEFRSKVVNVGDGDSITSISQLLGPPGDNGYAGSYNVTLKNFSTAATKTGLSAGIDNIRVVRIK